MAKHACASCKFRAKYDERPESLLGKLWRWHAGWCPGFKAYLRSLPEEERRQLVERYGLKR